MSWRDRMQPASFRGVEFHVEGVERTGGRDGVTHEFPFRDRPYRDDIRRATRTFPVEGYLIGDDYMAARDALIAALEKHGVGELRHPYYGTLTVAVDKFRIRETTADGGTCAVAIEFIEADGEAPHPTVSVDGAAAVASSAARAKAAAGAGFLDRFSPGTLMDSAADAVRKVTLTLDRARSAMLAPVDRAADMRRRLDRLAATADALVRTPGDLLTALGAVFDGLLSVDDALAAYDADIGPRPPATTATRAQEQANYDSMAALLRALAAIRAAEIAAAQTFESLDGAMAARDAVTERIDELLGTVDDDTFAELEALHADLVRAVPGEASSLPRLMRYTPPVTVPSLVLAHRLYGDVGRELDIVARNRIPNPALVIGGRELEVLSA